MSTKVHFRNEIPKNMWNIFRVMTGCVQYIARL